MKKFLLSAFAIAAGVSLFAQEKVYPTAHGNAPGNFQKAKSATVNDTITQPVFGTMDSCDARLFTYSNANNQIVTGNFELSSGDNIVKVSQALNLNNEDVAVEGIIAFVNQKEEGPSKGSFRAQVYDTTGGISANPLGSSDPVSFDNIDTSGNGANVFTFSNPVSIDHTFWATLEVDNNSDTLAVFSTNDDCGGGGVALFQTSAGQWGSYAQSFSVGQNDPLDVSLWIWAQVDTTGGTVGLNRNLIHSEGIQSYPNPTNGKTTIEFDMYNDSEYTLLVQGMSGTVVYEAQKTFNGDNRKFEADLSNLPQGAYTYQVIGQTEQRNGVLIKK